MKQRQSPREIPRTNDKRERIAAWVPAHLKRKFERKGGSKWLREIMAAAK